MEIKSIVLTHADVDVVCDMVGLEACLVNFTFADRMRFAFLNHLTKSNPGVPVFMKSSNNQSMEQVDIAVKTFCSSLDDFMDISCIENDISQELQQLLSKNRDSWVDDAKSAAQAKLNHIPKEWYDLFACVPRDKHLRVMGVLLSKSNGRSKGAHSYWMTEEIESILQSDDTQGGNAA